MKRRELLGGVGALAGAALAGCLSSAQGSNGDGSDADTGTTTASPTPTDSPTPAPSMVDRSFTVDDVTSGNGTNEATVSVDGEVVVDGTIGGRNGCYTASLQSAEYADGTLTVVVEAHEKEDAGACTQALVDIDYAARFAFEGSLPDHVVVDHVSRGERTTVADEKL